MQTTVDGRSRIPAIDSPMLLAICLLAALLPGTAARADVEIPGVDAPFDVDANTLWADRGLRDGKYVVEVFEREPAGNWMSSHSFEERVNSISLRADGVLLGDRRASTGRPVEGAAVFYARRGEWERIQAILPPVPYEGDHFGEQCLWIDDDLALISAPGDSRSHGVVHAFRYDARFDVWAEAGRIRGDASLGDSFGRSLAYHSGLLAIGDADEVFVFDATSIDPNSWAVLDRLAAPTSQTDFGYALDLASNRLAVGAPASFSSMQSGITEIFERLPDGTLAHVQSLRPDPGYPDFSFGSSLALSHDEIWVGSPSTRFGETSGAGACYRFRTTSQRADDPFGDPCRLHALAPSAHRSFGKQVRRLGARLVVASDARLTFVDRAEVCAPAMTAEALPSGNSVEFVGSVLEVRADDSGIAEIALGPESTNVTLDVEPFAPGSAEASFSAMIEDPALPALIVVVATDVAGNRSFVRLEYEGHPATIDFAVARRYGLELFNDLQVVTGIVSSDLDSDGRTDVVASNLTLRSPSFVTLRFGMPNGTLSDSITLSLSSPIFGPISTAAGNFGGDSSTDIVVAGLETIDYFENTGGRQFERSVSTNLGERVENVVSGDWNGDGKLDLLASFRSSIFALEGDGAGGFLRGREINLPGNVAMLLVEDWNHDGFLDVAATVPSAGAIFVWLGNGTGGISSAHTIDISSKDFEVVTTDFDGDDTPDLVVLDRAGVEILLLSGLGDGTFDPAGSLAIDIGSPFVEPLSLTDTDVDGDGLTDLVVIARGNFGSLSSERALLLYGDGETGYPTTRVSFVPTSDTRVATSADLDGNGREDIVLADGIEKPIVVARSDGNDDYETSRVRSPIPPGVQGQPRLVNVHAADLNLDGILDLLAIEPGGPSPDRIVWLRGQGGGRFLEPASLIERPTLEGLVPADIDDDGIDEWATIDRSVDELLILRASGPGALGIEQTLEIGTLAVTAGEDFDGDDLDDVGLYDPTGDRAVFYRSNGTQLEFLGEITVGEGVIGLLVADVDHDAAPDLMVRRLNGTFAETDVRLARDTFAVSSVVESFTSWESLLVADVDDDGNLDLLAGEGTRLFLGDGSGSFDEVSAGFSGAPFAVEDLNDDGTTDWLAVTGLGFVAVIRSPDDSLEAFQFATADVGPLVYGAFTSGDFDGDGLTDFVVVTDDAIHVTLNRSLGLPCSRGVVDIANTGPTDVLLVNGKSGRSIDPSAPPVVAVSIPGSLSAEMLLPPAGGSGRFVVHANAGSPGEATVRSVPAQDRNDVLPLLDRLRRGTPCNLEQHAAPRPRGEFGRLRRQGSGRSASGAIDVPRYDDRESAVLTRTLDFVPGYRHRSRFPKPEGSQRHEPRHRSVRVSSNRALPL